MIVCKQSTVETCEDKSLVSMNGQCVSWPKLHQYQELNKSTWRGFISSMAQHFHYYFKNHPGSRTGGGPFPNLYWFLLLEAPIVKFNVNLSDSCHNLANEHNATITLLT